MNALKRDRKSARGFEAAATRLARFLVAEQISMSKLSRIADVNVTYLGDIKSGQSEPTRPVMERIRKGAAQLLGREVHVTELFDFGGGQR